LASDNRHYATKFYRHVITRKPKYLFIPIYSLSAAIFSALSNSVHFTIWFICSCLAILPTPLFDVRYFILPINLFIINNLKSNSPSALTYIQYGCINLAVLYVFREHPWRNEFFGGELSRLYW